MAKHESNPNAGPFMIPMKATNDVVATFNIDRADIRWWKIGRKRVPAILVPATKAQYKAYMQELWAEDKADERKHRCLTTDKHGKQIRCPDNNLCINCEVFKAGLRADMSDLSVDAEYDAGHDLPTTSDPEAEAVISAQLTESRKAVTPLGPDYLKVFDLMCTGSTVREISEKLCIPKSTAGDMIEKIRAALYSIWH